MVECLVIEVIVHPAELDALKCLAFDGEELPPDVVMDEVEGADSEVYDVYCRIICNEFKYFVLELSCIFHDECFNARTDHEDLLEIVGFEIYRRVD